MNPFAKYFLALTLIAGLVLGCDRKNIPVPTSDEQCATCAARLRMLDGAKQLWAQKNEKTANDTPKLEELTLYLRGTQACPGGGTYTMTPVGELSACSVPEHAAFYRKSVSAK